MTGHDNLTYHERMMQRPDMKAYFRARIDHHVNGMMARTTARLPHNVKGVQGDVTDRIIKVTMLDGTNYFWQGGEYASRKVNLCYAPLLPKAINPPQPLKYEDGHTEHTDDCMSPWSEARRYTLPMSQETIEMNHRLHMYDVENETEK